MALGNSGSFAFFFSPEDVVRFQVLGASFPVGRSAQDVVYLSFCFRGVFVAMGPEAAAVLVATQTPLITATVNR